MVLGGLIVASGNVPVFESAMADFCRETRMFAELKWSKVTNQKYDEYRRFVILLLSHGEKPTQSDCGQSSDQPSKVQPGRQGNRFL
jgi:hypothetical protein